jgi:hypothetical protein
MKYLTPKSMTLAAAALLSSFALGAEAASVGLSTASQTHGSNHTTDPIHHLLFPADTYMIDDGTTEDTIGLTAGGDFIVLNEFAVIPGSETIDSVDIAWGSPKYPDPTLDGLPYTVCVWSDPNGDGSPADAVLLTTTKGVVTQQGTDTFINTPITPTTITTPNFFVGFLITQVAGQYPAAFDESSPLSNRSYYAADTQPHSGDITDLTNNEFPVATIESAGLLGNWLIRANDGTGENNIVLSTELHRQGGKRFVTLQWSPADAGTLNVLRNGMIVGTSDNGSARDSIGGRTGIFGYQVCQTDFSVCSNVAKVVAPPKK